jgi:hypothetical protein
MSCEKGGNSDLGDRKETLGERDDVLHLAHRVDAVLHGLRVLCARTIEDALDASNVVLGPLFIREANDLRASTFWSALAYTRP